MVEPLRKHTDELFQLARTYALSAHAAANKKGDDAEQAKKSAVKYAERAAELLEEIHAQGFFGQAEHRRRLTDSSDWQSLRGRQSFETLLQNLSQIQPNPKQIQP